MLGPMLASYPKIKVLISPCILFMKRLANSQSMKVGLRVQGPGNRCLVFKTFHINIAETYVLGGSGGLST